MLLDSKLLHLFAGIYHQEALKGSDMYIVTDILEQLRVKLREEENVMKVWDVIDDAVAVSIQKNWLSSMLELREIFSDILLNDFEENVNVGFKQSEEIGWHTAKLLYLTIFKQGQEHFLIKFLKRLSGRFTARKNDFLEIEQASFLMSHRRWVETYDFIIKVAKDNALEKDTNAHLWAVASAIQLYYIGNKDQAKNHIDQGLSLCPDLPYLKDTLAGYEIANDMIASARKIYEAMIRENPNAVEALNGIGNCFKKENEISIAEEWYNKAIATAPGNVEAYQNKISLYCSNLKIYEQKKDLIDFNVGIEEIINPEKKYNFYIDAGYACQLVNDYPKAEEWFQKAVNVDPNRVEGHVSFGHLYVQQIPSETEEIETISFVLKAEDSFKKAIVLGITCFDGYWGLNVLYQKLLNYDKAIFWLEKSYSLCPMFNELNCIELGRLYKNKSDWDKASANFLQALQINPESKDAIENAEYFGEQLSDNDSANNLRPERVKSFYKKILEIKGSNWKQRYYELITSTINKFSNEESALIEIYKSALNEFPDNSAFSTLLNELLFFKSFGANVSNLFPNPEPMAIVCDSVICKAFLEEGKDEFRPEFLDKIVKFRSEFKRRFGIIIPPIKFRQFDRGDNNYHFYTIFDEVYTTLGDIVHLDKKLALADEDVLVRMGIQADIVDLYYPFIKMCWIDPAQSEIAVKANIELRDPLDLIFLHLLFQTWSQMKRFCNYDDTDISSLIKKEDIKIASGLMQLMHALLDLRTPIVEKAVILEKFKDGITKDMNVQQIAREMIKLKNFKPVYPTIEPKFTYYKLDISVEEKIVGTFEETSNKQWASQILPAECQDVLSAIRNVNNQYGRCLVSDDRIADTISSIAKLEFPYFEFKTKRDLTNDDIVVDESIIEKITLL